MMSQAKRGTKEVIRQQVLETTPQVPDNAVIDWVAANKLVKEKQVAVAKIMLKVKTKAPPGTKPEVQTKKKEVREDSRPVQGDESTQQSHLQKDHCSKTSPTTQHYQHNPGEGEPNNPVVWLPSWGSECFEKLHQIRSNILHAPL
jgi:hypothetical protein